MKFNKERNIKKLGRPHKTKSLSLEELKFLKKEVGQYVKINKLKSKNKYFSMLSVKLNKEIQQRCKYKFTSSILETDSDTESQTASDSSKSKEENLKRQYEEVVIPSFFNDIVPKKEEAKSQKGKHSNLLHFR